MRAGGLAGLHCEDDRRYLFLRKHGSAFVALEMQSVRTHDFHEAAAALRVEVAVRDEGEGHNLFLQDSIMVEWCHRFNKEPSREDITMSPAAGLRDLRIPARRTGGYG